MSSDNSKRAVKFINVIRQPFPDMPEIDLLGDARPDLYKQAIDSAINTYPPEWNGRNC